MIGWVSIQIIKSIFEQRYIYEYVCNQFERGERRFFHRYWTVAEKMDNTQWYYCVWLSYYMYVSLGSNTQSCTSKIMMLMYNKRDRLFKLYLKFKKSELLSALFVQSSFGYLQPLSC